MRQEGSSASHLRRAMRGRLSCGLN